VLPADTRPSSNIDILHEIGSRFAASDPLHTVLERVLQRDLGITEEDAYLTIQRQSRHRRTSKREIAEAMLIGEERRRGTSVPEHTQCAEFHAE
jgi:hypothetical protein